MAGLPAPAKRRVADSVAARFAGSTSYREFLQAEAAAALHRAEAAAEVARRNAEAVAAAQAELLTELERWNAEPQLIGEAAVSASMQDVLPPVEQPLIVDVNATTTHRPAYDVREALTTELHLSVEEEVVPIAEPLEPALPLPANLIEFPRQLVAARKARPRLAEGPLREDADAAPERAQLRIFEVEASTLSPVAAMSSALPDWHTIRLDAGETPHTAVASAAQSSLSPIYAAPVSLRVMAATVDACCITSACLLAVVVVSYASPELPSGLFAAAAVAGTLALFALLYFLLFFSLNEATPGMRYARIGLCTFSDENPTRSSMRRRLFAVVLAGLPLGLGLVWMCLDEDGLGWHDRMSRMYLREY